MKADKPGRAGDKDVFEFEVHEREQVFLSDYVFMCLGGYVVRWLGG